MTNQSEIAVRQPDALALPDEVFLRQELAAVQRFQALVKETLVKGLDYGVIPGTDKPTLLKPGAEKMAKLLGLADTYVILSKTEDWKTPFFAYEVQAILTRYGTTNIVSTGVGECNSMESKYRWRWLWPNEVPDTMDKTKMVTRKTKNGGTQYRIENEDIYSQVNTLLKMAKKRALVDAALSAGRLSEIFTQDVEDLPGDGAFEGEARIVKDEPPSDAPICPVHNKPMKKGQYGWHCTMRVGDGWCKEKPPKNPAPKPQPTNAPADSKAEPPKAESTEAGEDIFPPEPGTGKTEQKPSAQSMATEAQKQEIIALGRDLGSFRSDDEAIRSVCTRTRVDEWADVKAADAATIIAEWKTALAARKAPKKGPANG